MEHITKKFATLILASALTACQIPIKPEPVTEAPKPTADARITQVCDTVLTPITQNPEILDFFVSYAEAIGFLNACACKHIEARNLLCKLTFPGCAPVPSCKVPTNDTK